MKIPEITARDFVDLSERLARGDITTASKQELERFTVMLCRPNASTRFPGSQFPQACETVRLLLLREHINTIERRSAKYQWLVIALAVAALVSSVVQIYVQVSTQAPSIAPAQPAPATQSAPTNPVPANTQ